MRQLKADSLFRPVFEGKAALAWAVALIWVLLLAVLTNLSGLAMGLMLLFSTTMVVLRYRQAANVWNYKVKLSGASIDMLGTSQINAIQPKLGDNLWLGWGWEWQPSHTQQAYDILKRDTPEIYAPNWFLRLNGIQFDPRKAKGRQWVHGMGVEEDIVVPFTGLAGHTAIAATTGAIKTTLYKLLVYQFALAGDTVIVIDPKGDKDLKKICEDAAAASGDPSRFISFHPAFPSQGVRFDGLKNWERETQVASRIVQIIGAGEEGNNFIDFCFQVITSIVACMKIIGRRPTIASILDHIRALENSERLCEDVLMVWLSPRIENLSSVLQEKIKEVEAQQSKPSRGRSSGFAEKAEPRLLGLIALFRESTLARPAEIDSLISNLESSREWFAKMIVALTPTLTKLSAGDLRGMLSPDYDDPSDLRPIYDMGKVMRERKIFYLATDALSDQSVASAIAAFAIADAAAEAGSIYNYSDPSQKRPRVHLLIDEAANALCAPLIEICNKGRGAGIHVYLAFQAFSDIVTKMGDVNQAKRFLANLNNMIVGATQDTDTLDLISDKFGEVDVVSASRSQGSGQKTEDVGLEYSATKSVSFSEKNRVMIPRSVLMSMPDLQYVAIVNRARIYKGRVPVLQFDN
jgi:conjugal transfer pilus assembly protein TraD